MTSFLIHHICSGSRNVVLDEDRECTESAKLLNEAEHCDVSKVELDIFENRTDNGKIVDKGGSASWIHCRAVLRSCFHPAVIGSVAGIVSVLFPWIRGLLVDTVDRNNGAPLQFLFDGLYAVGQSAIPINMMILGCNLSSSVSFCGSRNVSSKTASGMLSLVTMMGVVVGKMIIIPFIGILSAWTLKTYFWDVPKEIEGAFYLVLMIVFLTPTANNVMVMVELSGSAAKEGMANVIALQYLVAPIILSYTMTIAIGIANGWTA